MAEWAALPTEILVLIAEHIEIFEDYFKFYAVCKSWHSVTSLLGKFRCLPSRFPWIMLTDKAEINFPEVTKDVDPRVMLFEQLQKNEEIEGMHNRQFYSFSASKAYEFELPEATRRKCLGVGYGLLMTLGYDSQIYILNPFTRQQIGMPGMLSFNFHQDTRRKNYCPKNFLKYFVGKVAMSSNPYNPSNKNCIVMAMYGEFQALAFARPGDKVWTNVSGFTDVSGMAHNMGYEDVVYYNGNFYAVNRNGFINVCDINDANEPKATSIACVSDEYDHIGCQKYLVESSGDLLLVIRVREGPFYNDEEDIDQPYNITVDFCILKLEECGHGEMSSHNLPYKLTDVDNLGNSALFIGDNASVSVPCSRFVKANSIYFSDNEAFANSRQPRGGGYDTGIYDVESGDISLHSYASKFMSHLTPPLWIVS